MLSYIFVNSPKFERKKKQKMREKNNENTKTTNGE